MLWFSPIIVFGQNNLISLILFWHWLATNCSGTVTMQELSVENSENMQKKKLHFSWNSLQFECL